MIFPLLGIITQHWSLAEVSLDGGWQVRLTGSVDFLSSYIRDFVGDRGRATSASWKVLEQMESIFLARRGLNLERPTGAKHRCGFLCSSSRASSGE